MRGPKTHAKVLALREDAVTDAELVARRKADTWRWERLAVLLGRVRGARAGHRHYTGWSYNLHCIPPSWHHHEIIPDTEEGTP